MTKTIVQDVLFKNTLPKDLYDIYINADKHSKATGAPAEIADKEGSTASLVRGTRNTLPTFFRWFVAHETHGQ